MRKLLHVGCGPKQKSATTKGFDSEEWLEIRYDIDESVSPDYVGSMTDMTAIEDGSMDAVFSSHNIEHLYPHEVGIALAEFFRVLSDDGMLVLTCPDIQSVCELVAQDKLTQTAYESPAGPIAPIDILYGHRKSMQNGNLYMAHKCGFTEKVLVATFQSAGFSHVASMSRKPPYFDLWAIGMKGEKNEEQLRTLSKAHFPA
jgi:predicted SAM-dependent methyltransferase